jgi:hypothetical protein
MRTRWPLPSAVGTQARDSSTLNGFNLQPHDQPDVVGYLQQLALININRVCQEEHRFLDVYDVTARLHEHVVNPVIGCALWIIRQWYLRVTASRVASLLACGIAGLCQRWDVLAISDEIYERIVFGGNAHVPMASIPGMADRTITTGGLSKTYSVTGWRIGWAISPPALTGGIRKLHDFLTVAAPTPFHDAGVAALSQPEAFYSQLARDYETKRDLMMEILGRHGFPAYKPGGAYYVMADVSRFGFASDSEFAQYLVKEIGVATVPGSSFYIDPSAAPQTVRFCFSKRDETLHEADRRLARLSVRLRPEASAGQVTSGDRA